MTLKDREKKNGIDLSNSIVLSVGGWGVRVLSGIKDEVDQERVYLRYIPAKWRWTPICERIFQERRELRKAIIYDD